jgi:branched-chain amino acid transport system permease protein
MKRIVESPLGKILQAIRENEAARGGRSATTCHGHKLAAFVSGRAFSGLAGVLYAMLFGIVPLESIGFVFSGNVVFGHAHRRLGLTLRARHRRLRLSSGFGVRQRPVWRAGRSCSGLAFVIVVLFFRGGVVEAWARFWAWRAAHAPPGRRGVLMPLDQNRAA